MQTDDGCFTIASRSCCHVAAADEHICDDEDEVSEPHGTCVLIFAVA